MKSDSIIVRFGGEIGVKGKWTRHTYEKLLLRNIAKILKHYNAPQEKIIHKHGRVYIRTKNAQQTALKLAQVFGVSSISPAVETTSEMNQVVQRAVKLAKTILESGSSFAVRCHRVGKHSYSSMDICQETGTQILARLKDNDLKVDLENPDFTINVEIRDDYGYVYTETIQGFGGFPLGSQSRALCLLSGGIDSAVACWLVMKRGCPILPVYFDILPFTDEVATSKALDVARKLLGWAIGFPRRMYSVPHGKNLETFVKETPRKLTCILCKRMMYRIAEKLAEMQKAEGIVTGESIGEQASQTLHNLRVLDEAATRYPVHRPLLGFNKLETEKLARKIGTFAISTRRTQGCSAAPKKPATRAKLESVKKAEKKLDIEGMVEESVKEAEIVIL